MSIINIDGKQYTANETDNLLQVCLSAGLDIPYFCWHPALGSIGSCRQCAVKQYRNLNDQHGFLVMSCMTGATDGIFISINDEEARQFRRNVVECLMINHPHDCPVCEEGGNCHLQDMTVMSGHVLRRYRFTKRTHRNQNLGPFISHEMNRCITCYRCVRYYRHYADSYDLGVYGVHNNIYFGRLEDGILESEFSGNLIEICPTGVFTDKTCSRYYHRKWDIQFAPSICQQCSLGCNISLGERHGKICRIENRYNGMINHYFLCDRGRFGYGYINLQNRPHHPIKRCDNNSLIILNTQQALHTAVNIIHQSKKVIGIGSPRASIESNFTLRDLVGVDNFYTGINKEEQECLQLILKILRECEIYIPTLREIESYDAVLILGEDLTQTGARAALAVRQAIKSKAYEVADTRKIARWHVSAVMNASQYAKHPLFITSIDRTRLDDIAEWSYFAPTEDQARLGFAIAHEIDKTATAVEGLSSYLKNKSNIIAKALINAKKPLIISGTNAGSIEIIQAAVNIAKSLKMVGSNVGITMIANTVNSVGLSMIGGGSLEAAIYDLEYGEADCAIIVENDLHRHIPASRINTALSSKMAKLIVIDHQHTEIMNQAHLVLSASSFAESSGTVINNECRAQRFFQVYDPKYYDSSIIMLESWRWLRLIYNIIHNIEVHYIKLDHIIDAIVAKIPSLTKIKDAAPDSSFRIYGQKVARKPHRYSGRTAIHANVNIHETYQKADNDTMFTFSMEGNNQLCASNSHIPFAWAPGWNSYQAWNKFQDKIGGHLRYGDPGVRLMQTSKVKLDYFTTVPQKFKVRTNSWRVALYYHLFGSDELSSRSSECKSCIPQPYIKLNQRDADNISVHNGNIVSFSYEEQEIILPVIISKDLAAGQAGLPVGILDILPITSGMYINNLRKVI